MTTWTGKPRWRFEPDRIEWTPVTVKPTRPKAALCHCDGPPHVWTEDWCPEEGLHR